MRTCLAIGLSVTLLVHAAAGQEALSPEPASITEAKAQGRLLWNSPVWTKAPTRSQLRNGFPVRGLRQERSAVVVLRCRVAEEGKLTACAVLSERPDNLEAGEAALNLTRYYVAALRTRIADPSSGQAVEISTTGLLVNLTVDFNILLM